MRVIISGSGIAGVALAHRLATKYGVRNVSTWLRFQHHHHTGNNRNITDQETFTAPTITEHQGVCQYFKHRITCPMPNTCRYRMHKKGDKPCTGSMIRRIVSTHKNVILDPLGELALFKAIDRTSV